MKDMKKPIKVLVVRELSVEEVDQVQGGLVQPYLRSASSNPLTAK